MVNSNADALGIIFPNSYDSTISELTRDRSMASIPFAARYRLIDFVLSNMVQGGIDNITIMVRENYLSLLDHLGSGREWDLTRKNGGLNTIPPFAYKNAKIYNGRVEALYNIKGFLNRCKEKYVVISDANIAANIDFKKILDAHIETGADVTCVYSTKAEIDKLPETITNGQEMFYTFETKGTKITKIRINPDVTEGIHNCSMNIYVIAKDLLQELIEAAYINGDTYFERDILAKQIDKLNIHGYAFDGYLSTMYSLETYFQASMNLLKPENLEQLFSPNQIYTKIRDDTPTRYTADSTVKNTMAADGCVIEGTVENCILFRGVKVGKGAVVKNSILMQDTVVEPGADVEYIITDKNVTIGENKHIAGSESFPVYVKKHQVI